MIRFSITIDFDLHTAEGEQLRSQLIRHYNGMGLPIDMGALLHDQLRGFNWGISHTHLGDGKSLDDGGAIIEEVTSKFVCKKW